MAIMFGSARSDERGKLKNGKAGDQKQTSSTNDTKGEVSMQTYYPHKKGWWGFRFKNPEHAKKMAKAMKDACNNKFVGYDQIDRLDLEEALEKYGTMKDIAEPTECDCSLLIRMCIYQATGVLLPVFYTGNQQAVLKNSGLFYAKFSVTSSSQVQDGDILVTKSIGHTVCVVSGRPRTDSVPSGIEKDVLAWQKSAIADGFEFPKYGPDGEWGSECEAVARKAVVKMRVSKGEPVYKYRNLTKIVQKAVGVSVDGECGPKTDKAIIEYQQKRGLKADGEVGIKTWKKILGV